MNIEQYTMRWQSIFEQHQSSGLSIVGFCQAHKINVSTFYSWRKRIANKTLAVKLQHSPDELIGSDLTLTAFFCNCSKSGGIAE
jgi:transposase-like protein